MSPLIITAPSDAQLAFIAKLCTEQGWAFPPAVHSMQEASSIIDAMRAPPGGVRADRRHGAVLMPAPFEVRVDREEGFTLQVGGQASGSLRDWNGWRVRYRTLGSRGRWNKFLTRDDLAELSTSELQAVCAAHESRSQPPPRGAESPQEATGTDA